MAKSKSIVASVLVDLIVKLLEMVSEDTLKGLADRVLDWIENEVADSETKIDDRIVQPLIDKVRDAFDIPDGVDVDRDEG